METKRFIYCEDDGMVVGWFEEYPEYRTQGKDLDELRAHLLDLYEDIVSGGIRCVHKVGELSVTPPPKSVSRYLGTRRSRTA